MSISFLDVSWKFQKNAVAVATAELVPYRLPPAGRRFCFASSRRLLAKRRLPCLRGRSPDTDGDPGAPLTLGRVSSR